MRIEFQRLRRVMATGSKRVTTQDAAQAAPRSTERSVFLDCQNEILAATWRIATVVPQQRAERDLIQSHAANHQQAGQAAEPFDYSAHERRPPFLRLAGAFRPLDGRFLEWPDEFFRAS